MSSRGIQAAAIVRTRPSSRDPRDLLVGSALSALSPTYETLLPPALGRLGPAASCRWTATCSSSLRRARAALSACVFWPTHDPRGMSRSGRRELLLRWGCASAVRRSTCVISSLACRIAAFLRRRPASRRADAVVGGRSRGGGALRRWPPAYRPSRQSPAISGFSAGGTRAHGDA